MFSIYGKELLKQTRSRQCVMNDRKTANNSKAVWIASDVHG